MPKIYVPIGPIPRHAATHLPDGSDPLAGLPPLAHANTHGILGSDEIPLDGLGLPNDTTALNASTSAHGLLRKLSNVAAQYLNGVGEWTAVGWAQITGKPSTFAPSAHATSHQAGGTDAIALDTLATPSDVATLNASTARHGLLRKLSNVSTQFLNGQGNWTDPIPATVAARYTTGAGQTLNDNTWTVIDFGTKDFDTHNAVTTGATWKFTAPVAGYYLWVVHLMFASTVNWAVNEVGTVSPYINGSRGNNYGYTNNYGASNLVKALLPAIGITYLAATETLAFGAMQNTGSSLALFNSGDFNHVVIFKL